MDLALVELGIRGMEGRIMKRMGRFVFSALLGFAGGLMGVIIGVIGVNVLITAPVMRGMLEPDLNVRMLAMDVGIAVVVGVFLPTVGCHPLLIQREEQR